MSGGTLGRLEILPPLDVTEGSNKFKIYDDAMTSISTMGLTLPSAPNASFRGELPHDLTKLGDNLLGELLGNLAEYCGYVETELAKSQIKMLAAEATLEFTQASIRLGIKKVRDQETGKPLTVKDKDDVVITDPRVVEAQSQVLYTTAVYTLTRTILNKAQRNWDTVSRRITQRGQDIQRMTREGSVAGFQVPHVTGRFTKR